MRGEPDLTFMTEAEARPVPGDRVFRERGAAKLAMSVLLFALTGGMGAGTWRAVAEGGPGIALGGFLALMALALLVMFLIAFAGYRASRRPTSWILRATPRGLFLHYRSYLNHDFPADRPSAVLLPHREVSWIRAGGQTQGRGLPDDTVTEKRRYLEIGMRRDDLSALEGRLADERALTKSRKSRFNHFPVAVSGNIVRMAWRSPRTAIRPGLREALKLLGRDYPVVPEHAEILSDDDKVIDPAEQEERIRGHLARGEVMTATKLARHYFGYDLTEARKYVEALKGSL